MVIKGIGKQNKDFYKEPYKVYVNNELKESCKNVCEMEFDINNVTLIFEDNIESCENMFYGLDNITEINLSKFNFSKVRKMTYMFRDCYNLEKINFGNIDTSSVVNMKGLFHTCGAMTSIDLSNFDTSSATNMEAMFYLCSNLLSIYVSNFKLLI